MTENWIKRGVCACPWQFAGMAPDTPVLLAFSGGADSVALLDMLMEQKKQCDFPLFLAHVEHGIRGETSIRDRDFCIERANRLGLEIFVQTMDVPRLARESGKSLEEAAREARYAFFAQLMQQKQIPILVTAHHADDHLETLLFRLSRGTSPKGLCGIAPMRPFAGGMLVRPLLGFSKAMLLAYCQEKCLDFVTDETNSDIAYARNRIRKEVLPVLDALFSEASARAVRMSEDLREDEELLDSVADAFLQRHSDDGRLELDALKQAHAATLRRVLYQWFAQSTGASLESAHLRALRELIVTADSTARVALPGNRSAYVCGNRLCLMPTRQPAIKPYVVPLSIGEYVPEGAPWRITVQKMDDGVKIHDLSTAPYIILYGDFDIIKEDMLWRNRRDGDVLLLGGMHRKLRRLYAQKQIPIELRQSVPLLCRGNEILWAPFVGACDGFLQKQECKGSDAWLLQIHFER